LLFVDFIVLRTVQRKFKMAILFNLAGLSLLSDGLT